ncbi:hypothetical protein LIER_26986 [Lithospermum erythrorhizon]|uniref:Uncharacterized protein n=1 Tax=Lithospermum erythrorhizon TaxID=34254 RepID=A0AAV3RBX3_LITER
MDALHLSGSAPDFNSVSDPHEAGSSRVLNFGTINNNLMVENTPTVLEQQPPKKKRNTPGNHGQINKIISIFLLVHVFTFDL